MNTVCEAISTYNIRYVIPATHATQRPKVRNYRPPPPDSSAKGTLDSSWQSVTSRQHRREVVKSTADHEEYSPLMNLPHAGNNYAIYNTDQWADH